jgi:hypothetical protein
MDRILGGTDLWKTIFATLTIVGICAGSETLKGVEVLMSENIFNRLKFLKSN